MSLTDAMLLEGYRDPREIYIALRTDGLKGSGTIDDPYDGGTRLGAALLCTLMFNPEEFVVGLANHGLSIGSSVTIAGVQSPGDSGFNGSYTVHRILSPSHFTLLRTSVPTAPPNTNYSFTPAHTANNIGCRLYWPVAKISVPESHGLGLFDGIRLSGQSLPSDFAGDYPILGPFDSAAGVFAFRIRDLSALPSEVLEGSPISCTVQRLIHHFDEVMRAVPKYSVIRVSSGEFETRGYASLHSSSSSDFSQVHCGFVMRDGQRLLGAGMKATRLKLVLPLDNLNQTVVVACPSSPRASFSEVADLTVDANAAGHVDPFGMHPAPVTCGGVALRGSFIRLNRVRAIKFCTQAFPECFPLYLSAASDEPVPTFNVLENCVLEAPGENNTHESTLLNSGGNSSASARSPIVRHNFANCWYVTNNASSAYVAVASLSAPASGEFTLETKVPHGRTAGNNIVLSGVLTAGTSNGHPYFNQSFRIKALDGSTPLTKMTCEFPNAPSPFTSFDFSKAYIGVDFHGPIPGNGTGAVVEGNALFDCAQGIYQDTGISQDVVIRDNYFSNCQRALNINFGTEGGTNGAQSARTGVNLSSLTRSGSTATAISQSAHGFKAGGETVAISGVTVNSGDSAAAAPYNGDHFATPDATDPKKFTYTVTGTPPAPDTPTLTAPIRVGIYSLTRDSDPTIAILETAQPHLLKVGDVVRIDNAHVGGILSSTGHSYNDTTSVMAVISTTKFEYEMKNDPGGNADASVIDAALPLRWFALRQVRHLIFENNLCDLQNFDFNTGVPPDARPRGLQTIAFQGPPYIFPNAIIRGNSIRHFDVIPPVVQASGNNLYAMRIGSFRNTLIEHNVIGMTTPGQIHYTNGEAANGFNNRTTDGASLPVYADTAGGSDVFEQRFDGLEGRIGDAILMSLL